MRVFIYCLAALVASMAWAAEPPYLSGGVGSGEREAMQARKSEFNLRLGFAQQGTGDFMAGVQVAISDAKGAPLLSAASDGPWFYVKLPPGSYKVSVEAEGRRQNRNFSIANGKATTLNFYWP